MMAKVQMPESCPIGRSVVQLIVTRRPMHRKFLNASLAEMSEEEHRDAERYLRFLREDGLDDSRIADAYLTIVDDTFQEELYFRETGRYRCSSYAEAAKQVYDNPEYMTCYMIGLGLTSFWWINHVRMKRFFFETLPSLAGDSYLEVGPGHGIYFLAAIESGLFRICRAIDISRTSFDMTKRIVSREHPQKGAEVEILHGDFLAMPEDNLAAVLVMGEVLEHVEEPMQFLRKAFAVTTPEAKVFLATCINSPAIDHIYNPETFSALRALVEEARFKIGSVLQIPRAGKSLAECEQERLAVNVAMILEKQ